MDKILNINQAISTARKLRDQGKTIVLAGGCFDILHKGHILFLKAAKKQGDMLFLLLESDRNITKRKGEGRPLNSQKNRASVLSTIEDIDYIIPLTGVTKDKEYDRIMGKIKPDIVAMTRGDKQIGKRTKQCELFGIELKLVIDKIGNSSTTALINQISN